MMNLFVLIILDQFQENYFDPDNPLKKYNEDVAKFKEVWVTLTKENMGIKISHRAMLELILKLSSHFNFEDVQEDRKKAAKIVMNMNLYTDNEGFIYFNEVLYSTIKLAYFKNVYLNIQNSVAKEKLKKFEDRVMKKLEAIKKKVFYNIKFHIICSKNIYKLNYKDNHFSYYYLY